MSVVSVVSMGIERGARQRDRLAGFARRQAAAVRGQPGRLVALVRRHRWEAAAFGVLIALALGTRLWDVGGRTLHYDELLHAWYAWLFSEGSGYSHTPVTHGPFLFHAAAGTFFVFGANDVTARLLPALFGVALVGLPLLLRRELGSSGAVATALLLLASPSVLYFGRFIRNDIYMAVWTLLLVAIMWHYLERPRVWLLFAWIGVWAFAFTTKETSYILALILGFALFWMSAPHYWRWVRGRAKLSALPPAGVLFLVLVSVTAPLWAPLPGLIQDLGGIVLVNADPNDPAVATGDTIRAAAETGAPVGAALFIAAFLVLGLGLLGVLAGLTWNRRLWPLLAALFVAIWVPFYTSIFTNGQGFFTGLWGSLGYWMAQQPVERAGQPWYYYFLGLAGYEFLVLVPAVAGGAYLLWRGNGFDRFVIYWAATTLLAATYAGEKMPWLLVGVTLPMAVLAGRAIGMVAEVVRRAAFDGVGTGVASGAWQWYRPAPMRLVAAYGAGSGLMGLLAYAVLRAARDDGFRGAATFWLALLAIGALAWWVVWLFRRAPFQATAASIGLGALTLLLAFTGVASARAGFSYAGFERPSELLVYSQTGQETTYAAECIAHVAEGSGLRRQNLRVLSGESDNFAWQWRWYLRDYPNLQFRFLDRTPLTEPPDADVVVISQSVRSSTEPMLDGFTQVGELSHLWWFPNAAYDDLSLGDVWSGLTSREGWRTASAFFFSREIDTSLYRSQGLIYVADEYADLADGCTALRATGA